jgi:hypothetical protein
VGRFYLEAPGAVGGKPEKSVAYLEKSTALDPYFFLANAYLIRAYKATGQAARAKDLLASYKKKFAGLSAPMREVGDL